MTIAFLPTGCQGDLIESGVQPMALNMGLAPQKMDGAGLEPFRMTPKKIKNTCP